MRARSVTDVILGEAVSGTRAQRYEDMKAVASAMVNRSRALGVPLETVVQNTREFNAYNRSLPPGAAAYRDLAEQALNDVLTNGPTHNGTFYATPSAVDNLPNGLQEVTRTSGHVYFSDPQNRAIGTADGYRRPNSLAVQQIASIDENNLPIPSASPRGLLAESFPATPAPVQRGGLLADISPSSVQRGGMLADITPAAAPAFDMGRFGDPAPAQSASFDMGRFGDPAPTQTAGFDNARFGDTSPMNFDRVVAANGPAFDNGRFGGTQPNISYNSMVAQARAAQSPSIVAGNFDNSRFGNATTQPQGINGLRQGLLASNAQMAAPQGIIASAQAAPVPQAPSQMGLLADQYKQYGMGQAAMQQAMAPATQAANLAADVADQRAKMGLPPAAPAQPQYVDPGVTTQQPTVQAPMAPQAYAPATATNPGAPSAATGDFGPSMTPAQARAMERSYQAHRLGGGVLGGLLGGALLGPVGGLLGGYLGRNMGAKMYYPTAPQPVAGGNSQQISRATLNDRGRDTYQSSKQFRDAVDKGSAGLY